MIIAIKGVTDLYARASLRNLKCPTFEIRTSVDNKLTYDWIISAAEEFDITYEEGDHVNPKRAVMITVNYHGRYTCAYMSKGSYEYIVTFEGDIFTRKDEVKCLKNLMHAEQ